MDGWMAHTSGNGHIMVGNAEKHTSIFLFDIPIIKYFSPIFRTSSSRSRSAAKRNTWSCSAIWPCREETCFAVIWRNTVKYFRLYSQNALTLLPFWCRMFFLWMTWFGRYHNVFLIYPEMKQEERNRGKRSSIIPEQQVSDTYVL